MSIKNLILVTKFKNTSELSLLRALSIARDHGANLDILNVIDTPPQEKNLSLDQRVKEIDDSLKELISHEKTMRQIIRKAATKNWHPVAHITMENPNKTRERLLSNNDVDFIVVGFGDWSDALDLDLYISPVSNATPPSCPIWLIPKKARKNLRKQLIIIGDKKPVENQFNNFSRICEVALKKRMSMDIFVTSAALKTVWLQWLKQSEVTGVTIKILSEEMINEEVIARKPGILGVLVQSDVIKRALKEMDSLSSSDLIVI
jgi:hypothetical protein